jgi:hypothetical protein
LDHSHSECCVDSESGGLRAPLRWWRQAAGLLVGLSSAATPGRG